MTSIDFQSLLREARKQKKPEASTPVVGTQDGGSRAAGASPEGYRVEDVGEVHLEALDERYRVDAPPTVYYIRDYITEQEERDLMNKVSAFLCRRIEYLLIEYLMPSIA